MVAVSDARPRRPRTAPAVPLRARPANTVSQSCPPRSREASDRGRRRQRSVRRLEATEATVCADRRRVAVIVRLRACAALRFGHARHGHARTHLAIVRVTGNQVRCADSKETKRPSARRPDVPPLFAGAPVRSRSPFSRTTARSHEHPPLSLLSPKQIRRTSRRRQAAVRADYRLTPAVSRTCAAHVTRSVVPPRSRTNTSLSFCHRKPSSKRRSKATKRPFALIAGRSLSLFAGAPVLFTLASSVVPPPVRTGHPRVVRVGRVSSTYDSKQRNGRSR